MPTSTRNSFRESLLTDLLSQPTAPFHEGHIISKILLVLDKAKVPYFRDPWGNLILGVKSRHDLQKVAAKHTKDPLRVFVAHLDHPGFHGAYFDPKNKNLLHAQWHGGSPIEHIDGSRVWIAGGNCTLYPGTILTSTLKQTRRPAIDKLTIQTDTPISELPHSLFGGFAFRAPVWKDGQHYYTKAADDLVGAFAIISLALDQAASKSRREAAPWIGLLTRAEEVGFIGTLAHLQLGWYKKAKRPVLCVSLETSRTLPGAEIGKGPVVRLGDRESLFHGAYLDLLTQIAKKRLPDLHQRRIMDGGTCEATAFQTWGFPAIGISVPLGNYHNQSFEGGPDSRGPNGPAPEFVHEEDIRGMLSLCRGLIEDEVNWSHPTRAKQQDLTKHFRSYQKML